VKSAAHTILIVDDEQDMCLALKNILETEGYKTLTAYDGFSAVRIFKKSRPDLVLLDQRIPGQTGLDVLKKIRNLNPDTPVIILTAFGDVNSAVSAMKQGAFHYLTKPFDNEEILIFAEKALKTKELNKEVKLLRRHFHANYRQKPILGKSDSIKKTMGQAGRVAPTDLTVILQGESGSGKELMAYWIHQYSKRRNKPFVAVDCGTLPETLVESELFGYEKGAFTGADRRKPGQFELAEGGTIFLDEITNLNVSTQAKLLRVIQERSVFHLGGKEAIPIDVRIIAASNRILIKSVQDGLFREDLYHRLNEFTLFIPPLRERVEDIQLLADHFLAEANKEFKKNVKGYSKEAIKLLLRYQWPGNVRELKNAVMRAVLLSDRFINPKDIQITTRLTQPINDVLAKNDVSGTTTKSEFLTLKNAKSRAVARVEKDLIEKTLKKTNYNKSKTAKMLQIDRKALYYKMKQYNLS